MCKGNSIAILNCPYIVSIHVFAVRVRNLIGWRTESDWAAYEIGIDNERER